MSYQLIEAKLPDEKSMTHNWLSHICMETHSPVSLVDVASLDHRNIAAAAAVAAVGVQFIVVDSMNHFREKRFHGSYHVSGSVAVSLPLPRA